MTRAVMADMYGGLPDGRLAALEDLYRCDVRLFGYPMPGFELADAGGAWAGLRTRAGRLRLIRAMPGPGPGRAASQCHPHGRRGEALGIDWGMRRGAAHSAGRSRRREAVIMKPPCAGRVGPARSCRARSTAAARCRT